MGIAVLLLVSAMSVLPGVQVEAALELPSLDWFEIGHNFHYRLYNSSISMAFNATITGIDGNELTWNFWDHRNGTDDRIVIRGRNKSRENLNLTDVYTFMWVNETNVNTESAVIGNTEYQIDLLESTDSTLVFENDNRTFRYNATSGWLKEADLRDRDLTWELVADNDHADVGNNLSSDSDFCEESEDLEDWPGSDHDSDSTDFRMSVASVCYDRTVESNDCRWKALGVSGVQWVAWLINFENARFTYDHEATGAIDWQKAGRVIEDGELLATQPLAYWVLTDNDHTHNGFFGQEQDIKSATADAFATYDPVAENTWTC